MDKIVGVAIKQEQDPLQIFPEQVWLEILPEIIKTDLDIVKTEHQYCINYNENCSNNLPRENGLFLKEEDANLEVAGENSINKMDIDEHVVPTHVILKYREDYDESANKQWVKEEQGIERRENALDEILAHEKLDLSKISPKPVRDLKTEIDLDDIMVKSEDQFCINRDENSSDNLPSENGLVSKVYPSADAVHCSKSLDSEYDSDVKLVNKINYDQQDVSREVFFQENVELQTDVKIKLVKENKKGNRNKTSISKDKRYKCQYCVYETQNTCHFKEHISAIHEKGSAKAYYCPQCTFRTLHAPSLHRHIKLHEKRAPYKCPGCEKCFYRKAHFDNHLLKNHENLQHLITSRIHSCKFCAYKTIYSKNLTAHVTYNHDKDGAEKFHCHKCDYFALQKVILKRHLLVHLNTKPYLCSACEKGFLRKTYLDSHILSNHKENADLLKTITNKIHQCTFCSYKTIYNQHLYGHIKGKHKQTSTEVTFVTNSTIN